MSEFSFGIKAPINTNVESGVDNPGVISAMDLMKKAQNIRNEKENEWRKIQELFEQGFEVSDPSGVRKIESQVLFQAIYKTVSKMKPLDVTLHAPGANDEMEKVTTDGVSTVLQEGGFVNVLRDKFGAFYRLLMFGDAFIRIGVDDKDKKYPIKFQNNSLLNVYVDPFATTMRTPASENDIDELVAIYKYSWDEAIQIYPKLEEIGGIGDIPRQENTRELDISDLQEEEQDEREVEIGHYYCRSRKRYTVFAGSSLTVLEDVEGDEYPFMKDGDAYIPFIHLMCFPSAEGFYNYGLGHILYRLAILTRQLMNRGVNYGMDNVDPIRMVNIPEGESSTFFNKLISAQEAQAAGRKGFIINEYSALDPNANRTTVETFKSDPITSEWERLFNMLDREIKRLGINLDDIDRGRNVTATQIIAEEENADLFVKQILEQNASEFKFVWELTIEMIKKFIKKSNKTPINMTTNIVIDGLNINVKGITMGQISDELSKKDYFVKVNARSGAIPSNVLQQAQISRALQFAAPGTPAFTKLALKFMRLNDQDVTMEDLGGQVQQPKGDLEQIASETDQLSPRSTPGQVLPAIA